MGDRIRTDKLSRYVTSHPPRPIHTLRGTENEYWPKCGDALRLGNTVLGGIKAGWLIPFVDKWINVWVAGKAV